MTALRLRILILMLITGLGPLTLLVVGVRFLPGDTLPWLWYGLLGAGVVVASVALCGFITRPLKDSITAMRLLISSTESPSPRAWVPEEYWAMRDSLVRTLAEQREERTRLEEKMAASARQLGETEQAAVRSIEVLHAIVESSTEAVVFMHSEGRLSLINDKARQLLHLEDEHTQRGVNANAWLDKVAEQFKDSGDVRKTWRKWQEAAAGGGEGEWETMDVEPRTIKVRCVDVRSDKGICLGRVWMFHDCTAERLLATRLQDGQKLESMGQLAGGIAHDFNNLLTAIRGNLNLAELEDDPARQRERLAGAMRAANRASELVNQILGFSRKTTAHRADADLCEIVNEVQNILRASIDPKVTLRTYVGKETWKVTVEPVQIEQVILNLSLNARDALPENGGTIDITTTNLTKVDALHNETFPQPPGDYVVVKIKDNGCGIPKEVRNRVFEPFFTTKAKGKGTGLGLAMARSIVEQAGGWIELESEIGHGTEFRIFLPRSLVAEAPPVVIVEPDPRAAAKIMSRGGAEGTILVVDDEAPVRSIAVNMLKYLGYKVLEACDGQEAIDILRASTTPIDAMMMDVYMPKLSGRDTFKQIRNLGIDIPVVVCSGFAVEADEFTSLIQGRHGTIEVIQKPYSMEALAKIVAKAVDKGHQALVA
ncbi:MAG: Two-component system, cell cycle sensor histidine kinase and response regulator CckA [Verrucomicrobiaceae bacterium]|nr:Two-component system, cell cycle sensor histidine kinase and response regulator CckA [Verrucomicrobiaceae bacterium]